MVPLSEADTGEGGYSRVFSQGFCRAARHGALRLGIGIQRSFLSRSPNLCVSSCSFLCVFGSVSFSLALSLSISLWKSISIYVCSKYIHIKNFVSLSLSLCLFISLCLFDGRSFPPSALAALMCRGPACTKNDPLLCGDDRAWRWPLQVGDTHCRASLRLSSWTRPLLCSLLVVATREFY